MKSRHNPRYRPRLLGLVLGLLLPAAAGHAQVNVLNGLVAHWSFEDNYEDSVGIFDGTAQGSTPPAFVAGKPGFGKAIKLNGEDQFVEVTGGEPDDLAFEGGSVSIAGWFKVDAFDTEWQALVAKGEGNNWRVARRSNEQGIAYAGGLTDTPTGKSVNDGQWHHFVAISDAEGTQFGTAMYVDGVRDTIIEGAAALTANGARMMIGENPGARGREFEGELDDIAVWNRVLTDDEIKALYNNGAGKPISSFKGVEVKILGVGVEALLGSDLTDPENDGLDALGAATDPSWNWAGITSSHEPDFEGGENSFNIFDNKVGGGNDKWCCDDPTTAAPVWVSVQFKQPVSINRFTVTSGNDSPDRDPTDWAIQGSADGASWTDIYRATPSTPVPWTERNQVVLFTLPDPSPAYRYIRYVAWATPGTLHQINEIEYFGNYGAGAIAYASNIRNTITSFGFRLNDEGTSVVDPASVKLVLDGANIPLGTLTKVDGKIDVLHTPASVFLPGSVHTYAISAKDNFGNDIVSEGEFTTRRYALLTAAEKANANTAQPGFVFNVHQNAGFQANDNVRPVQQLAGQLGPNHADPNVIGPALNVGTPTEPGNLPIRFEIPTVINLNQDIGGGAGNIPEDSEIPGVPGIEGSTDGVAAEILTFIELPAGLTTMIFNSDDGFRTTAGLVTDVFKSQLAGEFVGGRGASDTSFEVYAESAGTYAFRTIWYEGGGGANLEWLTVKADGTKVLINDTANGGLRAYRAVTGSGPTVISAVSPLPGATGVLFDSPISATLRDGDAPVDVASVKVSVDGVVTSATANKANGVTTISYTPSPILTAGSHTASITYTAGGASRTESWTFTVAPYGILGASHKAVSFDNTKRGFVWNVFQNEAVQHTTLNQTEQALAGTLASGGVVLPNLADPSAIGAALANGVKVGPLFKFEIEGVINLSQTGGEANGNFPNDEQMPGIPGTNGGIDGIDAEIITFVELPAGIITLGVNSDDGFRTQAGYINVPADGIVLGQFDGGRGASDTIFKLVVNEAGVYPLRTIWQEGGGGANIEIFSVKADGTKVLLNDTAAGGYRTFRVGVAPAKPVGAPTISVARNANGSLTVTFEGTLETATQVQGPYTAQPGTSPATITPNQPAQFMRARQ